MITNSNNYIHQSLAQKFLFCQTNTPKLSNKPEKLPAVGLRELCFEFPYMLKGKSFIDDALLTLESSSKFGVILIQIDNFNKIEEISGKKYVGNVLIDAAKTVNYQCQKVKGLWGLIERDLFGCFFPQINEKMCRNFAKHICRSFAQKGPETLSAGIALYPFVHFNKIQTINNARKALDHAVFLGPDSIVVFDAASLNISGDKLYQQGNINKAVIEFKNAVLLDPSNMNIHNSLGVCYGILGAFKSAVQEFKTAAQLDTNKVMPLYNAGLIYMKMDNYEKALRYFLKAGSLEQKVFEVEFQTARLYMKMGNLKQGEIFLKKAIKINPESASAFRYLGQCYELRNMTDKAISAYKKAVKYNPEDAKSYNALGWIFNLVGENPEIVLTLCKHSIAISPNNGLFRQRLGRIYLKHNKQDKALEEFKNATNLGCDSTDFIKKISSKYL